MKKKYIMPQSTSLNIDFSSICGTIESGGVYDGIGDIDTKERDKHLPDESLETGDEFEWKKGIW